jgi:hypothetical protein
MAIQTLRRKWKILVCIDRDLTTLTKRDDLGRQGSTLTRVHHSVLKVIIICLNYRALDGEFILTLKTLTFFLFFLKKFLAVTKID